ncbi:hypothetical protein [Desulfitobacterium sp.]|uniref:hypothetical protein n=1 Tax=Desulfitobacterium sp. TaxID=49981 RepID=UPI002B5275A7|nr:hypothetical protein [Desulfitobacterium sp.]HVJ48129.1 hypothetical protein [Desulfitobacterium sp.]
MLFKSFTIDPDKRTIQWSERIQLVAAEIHCDESSVRRWRNEMIDELAILLFWRGWLAVRGIVGFYLLKYL